MKNSYAEIELAEELFYLLPQKAVFRPTKKQLILSDLHLGKVTHFRKEGIALPALSHLRDIDKIHFLLNRWKPSSVLILGDLFHSNYNKEWLWFKSLLMEHADVQFILIEGNHDILDDDVYSISNLLKARYLIEPKFIFSHHPLEEINKINFCGHVHPGLHLDGAAKQSVNLPCFYFDGNQFILPAFGELTGLNLIERKSESEYYLIMQSQVVKL